MEHWRLLFLVPSSRGGGKVTARTKTQKLGSRTPAHRDRLGATEEDPTGFFFQSPHRLVGRGEYGKKKKTHFSCARPSSERALPPPGKQGGEPRRETPMPGEGPPARGEGRQEGVLMHFFQPPVRKRGAFLFLWKGGVFFPAPLPYFTAVAYGDVRPPLPALSQMERQNQAESGIVRAPHQPPQKT